MEPRSGRVVVLAGPGVIEAGAVDGLRAFADAGRLGVANTWGAKGAFAWDSPHHLGTCGLQARDFELLGFGEAEVIVATGIDQDESPRDRFALAPVIEIPPNELAARAGEFVATGDPLPNDLYPRLAAVAQPGYVDEKVPLHPARAVADVGAALPDGGLLTAEPGLAGLWVARTFPTPALEPGQPRRVIVPARREPGAALQLAVEAARAGRPAIAIVVAPLDNATRAVFDAAEADDVPVTVVVWDRTSGLGAATDHAVELHRALRADRTIFTHFPVALDDTQLLVDAAGEVVAWGGLESSDL